MRSKLANESRLLLSIRTWLVIKIEGNTSYWMGSGSFFLLSFYFKINYNGAAGEPTHRVGMRLSWCSGPRHVQPHFCVQPPALPTFLFCLVFTKDPFYYFLSLRWPTFFFLMTFSIHFSLDKNIVRYWSDTQHMFNKGILSSLSLKHKVLPLMPVLWFTRRKTVFTYIQRNTSYFLLLCRQVKIK